MTDFSLRVMSGLLLLAALVSFAACSSDDAETPDGDGSDGDTVSDGDLADGDEPLDGDADGDADGDEPGVTLVPALDGGVALGVQTDALLAEVDPRFLSIAVDSSQAAGGNWWSASGEVEIGVGQTKLDPYDFKRPQLIKMTKALAPAYLRIGGSEADMLYYDLSDEPLDEAPEPFHLVFTKQMFDDIMGFAAAVGFDVMFTLNAGPATRDENRDWQPDQAATLVGYAADSGYRVDVWELGNEINGYAGIHGITWRLSGEQYAADVATAREMLDELDPDAWLAGPSSAYWPVEGEMLAVMPDFMPLGGQYLDLVTWHYYATQSQRCPFNSRLAESGVLMQAENLDEISIWAEEVEDFSSEHAPQAEVWLGETGNAQCGGQPGVSDRFEATFWWLDELGQIAARGQQVVVRQCLSGSNYSLLVEEDLSPKPDYWASLLFKRLMGPKVVAVDLAGAPDSVRAYAHCTPTRDETDYAAGALTVVVLNLDTKNARTVTLPGLADTRHDRYLVGSDALDSTDLTLNGTPLVLDDGELPELVPERVRMESGPAGIELPPMSWAFLVFPDAGLGICE